VVEVEREAVVDEAEREVVAEEVEREDVPDRLDVVGEEEYIAEAVVAKKSVIAAGVLFSVAPLFR
jgi:hypothetical protein